MSKPGRRQITESMITTGQLDKTIQKVYRKSLEHKKYTENPRGREFLFIPKWIFLSYLRSLDRSIIHIANEDGLKMYRKYLIQVGIFILVC